MATHDLKIDDLLIPAFATASADFVDFMPGFVYIYRETPLLNIYFSNAVVSPAFAAHRVTVTPVGVAYPGDLAAGEGSYKVTLDMVAPLADIVMTRCENINMIQGWCVITKGPHRIAFAPMIVAKVTVEPTT